MKALFIATLGLLIFGCAPERGATIDFKAAPLKPGGDITFSKVYAGKPALIYVWATWCQPCRQVAPTVSELRQTYAPKGVSFIALAMDEVSKVQKFEQATPHGMDVVIDTADTLSKVVDTSAIPLVMVVDAEHRVVAMQRGLPTDQFAAITSALDAVATK